MTDQPKAAAAAPELPVLYRRPVALEPGRFAGKSLREMSDFRFAGATNSVAVNTVEFLPAMRSYPIVFTAGEPPAAIAVLGFNDRENLFVDGDGKWRADAYVPAYIRRYPFIFMEHQGGSQFILCIDEASDLLVADASRPLFLNGEPTDAVRRGLAFCGEYQTQYNGTREFVAALDRNGLLVSSQIQIAIQQGQSVALRGFRVIDEAKFNALPDEVFLEWRKRGWLALIYCHFMSLTNWGRLAELTRQRLGKNAG
jgi:hypothetical protein